MPVHDEICRAIDRLEERAVGLGRQIHARPELKFQEHFAAEVLTGALQNLGVPVERGVAGLETSFRPKLERPGQQWPSSRSTMRSPTDTPAATISSALPPSRHSADWPPLGPNCPVVS